MKRVLLIIVLWVVFCTFANASLIRYNVDDPNFTISHFVYDTNTDWIWADPYMFRNMSYDEIKNEVSVMNRTIPVNQIDPNDVQYDYSFSVLQQDAPTIDFSQYGDWKLASLDDVRTLEKSYHVDREMEAFYPTSTYCPCYYCNEYWIGFTSTLENPSTVWIVEYYAWGMFPRHIGLEEWIIIDTTAHSGIGAWIVSKPRNCQNAQPVPEPSTVYLLGLAFVLFYLIGQKVSQGLVYDKVR